MSMHLVGPYMTTTSYKKRKSQKMTAGKLERLQKQHREHNKRMKQIHCHSNIMTFDEYVDYVQGNYKPKQSSKTSTTNFDWNANSGYRRSSETDNIPSANSSASFAPATKKEAMQYTGERKLIGIATMHKSNMVPIFADEEDDKSGRKAATEIATMRRG